MKRYAIVYADGSNRRLTQIDYPSRKEAGDALIYFLTCNAEWKDEWDEYVTHSEEGDDYDDVPASMLDERHMKFAKPNMPTHWMKMPTHP